MLKARTGSFIRSQFRVTQVDHKRPLPTIFFMEVTPCALVWADTTFLPPLCYKWVLTLPDMKSTSGPDAQLSISPPGDRPGRFLRSHCWYGSIVGIIAAVELWAVHKDVARRFRAAPHAAVVSRDARNGLYRDSLVYCVLHKVAAVLTPCEGYPAVTRPYHCPHTSTGGCKPAALHAWRTSCRWPQRQRRGRERHRNVGRWRAVRRSGWRARWLVDHAGIVCVTTTVGFIHN